MSRRSDRLASRAATGIVRGRSGNQRGIITLRHFTRLAGTDPAVNPPNIIGLVVDGAHAPGATSLAVRGTRLTGRFIPGDIVRTASASLTVLTEAIAAANAAVLPLSAPLAVTLADATPLTPEWLNERSLPAEIQGLGKRMPDGRLIQSRDLFLTIAARALPFEPDNGDRVFLPGGDIREIITITPALVDGVAISYRLQVR